MPCPFSVYVRVQFLCDSLMKEGIHQIMREILCLVHKEVKWKEKSSMYHQVTNLFFSISLVVEKKKSLLKWYVMISV